MRLAYISFDTVPAPKGAATHIAAFTRALGAAYGPVDLVTVSRSLTGGQPTERWPGVIHTELPSMGTSLVDRVLCFRACLRHWLRGRRFDVIQFRSIYEGVPLLALRPRPRLIFEVNGLPSVELKYRYPKVADDRELMRKIVAQEQACLAGADCIVTPSALTSKYLVETRGIRGGKVRVIANGVDCALFQPAECRSVEDELRLLYFGTLASWQGVDLAIRATAQVCAVTPARLTILGAASARQTAPIAALAAKLGIGARVDVPGPVDQAGVAAELRRTFAVLAPLAVNDRNTKQGCCPLKILEGMGAGVPVIASDLPVVRELGENERHFLLVKPGSVDQITQAVLRLRGDRELCRRVATEARAQVLYRFTWERAGAELVDVCRHLLRRREERLEQCTERGSLVIEGEAVEHAGARSQADTVPMGGIGVEPLEDGLTQAV